LNTENLKLATRAKIGILPDRGCCGNKSILLAIPGQVVLVNPRPATKLDVGLLAVVYRTFPGAESPGLECLLDGWFIGWNASPEKKMIRPVGQPVFDGEGRRVLGDGRQHERFIEPRPATNFMVRLFSVEGRPKIGIKRACLEGVEDGFLFGGNACGRETVVCPRGKAV
jgi:hypothetical protein